MGLCCYLQSRIHVLRTPRGRFRKRFWILPIPTEIVRRHPTLFLNFPFSRTLHHSHLLLKVSLFLLFDRRPGEPIILTLSLTLSLHYCCVCSPGHIMDPLESYRLTVRNLLGTALREHRGSRRWHYAIDMEETNQDSLASYLGLTHKELCSLLLATGLAHFHGKQFRILRSQGHSSYSWQQFLVKQSTSTARTYNRCFKNWTISFYSSRSCY